MIYIFVALCSFVLTFFIREYALKKELLDHPNDRSSHEEATPRFGGVAIIISFFIGLFYLYYVGEVDEKLFYAFLSSIPLIIVSFLDDLYTLSAKLRFFVQVITVTMTLYFIGGESVFLNILFALGMLWLINLYNFLDGIDGYAVSEAVFVSFTSFVIFQNPILLVLGVASLGFMPFNWQRASIFMGDVGSTFLGFSLGLFVVYFGQTAEDIVIWLILLAIFWVDATWILYRRFKANKEITKAHKSHFFQRATQAGLSHKSVTTLALGLNIVAFLALYFAKATLLIYLVLALFLIILFFIGKLIDKRVPFK